MPANARAAFMNEAEKHPTVKMLAEIHSLDAGASHARVELRRANPGYLGSGFSKELIDILDGMAKRAAEIHGASFERETKTVAPLILVYKFSKNK